MKKRLKFQTAILAAVAVAHCALSAPVSQEEAMRAVEGWKRCGYAMGVDVVATLLGKSGGGEWREFETKRVARGDVKFVVPAGEETALFKISLSFASAD